jgi:hypothetical protein
MVELLAGLLLAIPFAVVSMWLEDKHPLIASVLELIASLFF